MAKCQEMRDATGGNFRVAGASLQEVLVLLEEWCKASDGHRFHYLAARLIKAPGEDGENSLVGIDFLYSLPGEKRFQIESKDFVHKRTDQLRRRFGNGLARWDITCPVTMVQFKAINV
jgi:hypothetical protein